jgi:transcriptional regulator GlxA family with amidase domain
VVGLLLHPDFILLSYAAIVESLRAANQLSQRALYAWRHISLDGRPVRSLTGAEVRADSRVGEAMDLDLLVIASTNAIAHDEAAMAWLRRLARQGVQIAGIAGGVYLMAKAGLLDRHRCAVHWAHASAFLEEFPNLSIQPDLYVIDGSRITCAGSGACADLIHALIEGQHGSDFAVSVDEWLTHGPRPQTAPQRSTISEKLKDHAPKLARAIAAMERHLEEPLGRDELAAAAQVSVRQLERLFRRQFDSTIADYYRDLRLDHARRLLRHTSKPVGEVALAAGFSSASYFCRAFKARFGRAPQIDRADRWA